jgi:uncharacterized membrane protein (UPF0182 family)
MWRDIGGGTLKNKRSILVWLFFIALFVLISFSTSLVNLYTDWLWFAQVGYASVFTGILLLQIKIGCITGFIFFIFLYANMSIAKRMKPSAPYWIGPADDPIYKIMTFFKSPVFIRFFSAILFGVALLFAFTVGMSASSSWETVLRYLHQTPFGIKDPVFNLDIGFQIFSVPFFEFLLGIGYQAVILAIFLASLVHWINGGIAIRPGARRIDPHAKAHLSVLFAMFFILLAVSFRFSAYDLLQSSLGVVYGAGYTDVHAKLPALSILSISSLIAAALFLINIHYRGWKLPAASMVFIVVVGILAGGIYPAIVQQYRVSPNEIDKETPYIKHGIEFTNKAYQLDKMRETGFPAELNLDKTTITDNKETIDNVRLWDWKPLLTTYNQIQSIRLYYGFTDVDVDRYRMKDGSIRQVTLSARELDTNNLPENAKTWVNQHLVYTHGYGIVANRVNEFSDDGLPRLIVEDIPPKSEDESLKVKKPQIYFGESNSDNATNSSDDYVIVGTKTKEFDYPEGDGNKYTTYSGKDGVKLNGLLRKALFSWRFGSLKLFISDSITDKSKALFHRNILERIRLVAPFLTFESDPYVVIDKGKLYWIVDAFTTDDRYPYSQPYDGRRNYIRNSVKVVIDAYDGTVNFYTFDKKDPLIKTYGKAFPGLFKDSSQLSPSLNEHIRYPEALFTIQSQMFTLFHMKDPQVFYNKEDLWTVSKDMADGEQTEIEPYYIQMQMPGESERHFIMLNTFTPVNKSNMIAWMAANSDPENYGDLTVYMLPKQKLVYGPMQIDARINQTPDISQQLTLWNQQGSRVIRGNIFVIPIDNSILYVEPLYLQSEQTELPELKRVIVSYGSKIAMEKDLTTALNAVFGEKSTGQPSSGDTGKGSNQTPAKPATVTELVDQAERQFAEAEQKAENGDWAGYGQALEKLKKTLTELKKQTGQNE